MVGKTMTEKTTEELLADLKRSVDATVFARISQALARYAVDVTGDPEMVRRVIEEELARGEKP